MVPRTLQAKLEELTETFPIVTVTGPRQAGKTTLCRSAFPNKDYVNLELPDQRRYAEADPRDFLEQYAAGAIIDEVQRVPELLSYLQVAVDEDPEPGRFILTGSANFALLESISQSLVGRTGILNLLPMEWEELQGFPNAPQDLLETLWSGSYPAVYDRQAPPVDWYGGYLATYVERDVRQMLNIGNLPAFQTFLELCGGRIGQLINLTNLGSDCGVTHNTVRSWIAVLETSFILWKLRPYHSSDRKRLVKTPKLYFYDTGLLCYLLGIRQPQQLHSHPLRGAIFENWVLSEILKARLHRGWQRGLYFYRDSKGLEIDLILERNGRKVLLEAKSAKTVASDFFENLRGVQAALEIPSEQCLKVLAYGGKEKQKRGEFQVCPWNRLGDLDWTG